MKPNEQPIDELYIAERVRRLRANGFTASEGYYMVLLSPTEAVELKAHLIAKREKRKTRYRHVPTMLIASAYLQQHEVMCVIDNALVVSVDHTRVSRRSVCNEDSCT